MRIALEKEIEYMNNDQTSKINLLDSKWDSIIQKYKQLKLDKKKA